MKFFEEYPEFNGYSIPPYLLRIQEAEGVPNTSLNRALLRGALENHGACLPSVLDRLDNSAEDTPDSQDWTPYKSRYISEAQAGIRAAYETAQMERANRELLLIAREKYNRLYANVKDIPPLALEENIRVLLMPKILEKMIAREKDYVKRFNQEFLMNCFYLWMSEAVSPEPNANVLYYPYHMILDYRQGN